MNRVVIVGPGAVGCYVAAVLGKSPNLDVSLLDHRPERAAVLARSGVCVATGAGEYRVPVKVSASPGPSPADTVVLCVKAFDTRGALDHARDTIGPATLVVSLQNGLGNTDLIAERADPARVVAATGTLGAYLEEPGHVILASRGTVRFAPLVKSGLDGARRLSAAFTAAGLPVELETDAETLVWSKLLVNAAINPVTALANVKNGELLERPDLRETALAAARETESVAHARGIRLAYADAAVEVERVCRATAANRSSMLQDLAHGRRTEVEQINGAIVRQARRLGIEAPVNDRLCRQILTCGRS